MKNKARLYKNLMNVKNKRKIYINKFLPKHNNWRCINCIKLGLIMKFLNSKI